MYDCIIIIYFTLRWNNKYLNKGWIRHDDNVWLTEPKGKPYKWIEKLTIASTLRNTVYH